ncbi:MAG: 4-hydroxythreonine-4-phosphate dehydrogenase PdxA [Planctomycetota bacterium]
MGDPAGIGPEVVVKALDDAELRSKARFVVYGLNEQFAYAADLAELDTFWWRAPYHGRVQRYGHDVVVVDYDHFSMLAGSTRGPSAEGGKASMRFCLDAIQAARAGMVDAVVTAPIAKQSWHEAGYRYPGHTELFAEKTGARNFAMMFAGGPIRVALATVHVGLNSLWGRLNIGAVYHPIELLHHALRDWFDIAEPHIAVCGLNPHAGENGAFGDEEERIIQPAMQMAQQNGVHCTGPYPADTVFMRAMRGEFDAVVAMYHDQGLIPVKMVAFDSSVNLTLGLPIVRTSPDHGTAFDIAGKNQANPGSMKAAIRMAIDLANRRRNKARVEAERKTAWE